jgi:hypothetical protein
MPGCVVTLIDRLLHCVEIVALEGKSYRFKKSAGARCSQSKPA